MNRDEVESFIEIYAQMEAMHAEIGLLSKRNPNDGVNKFKLKFINGVLKEANKILGQEHRPFDDFKVFDEDSLPTNSDVALILGQYISCMEELRAANVSLAGSQMWYWNVNGERSDIRTAPPKKLGR